MLRPPAAGSQLSLAARVHHRRGLLLLGLGGFQLWLWGTRVVNLLGEADSFSTAFVAVHLVLYIAAIGAGVLLVVLGWRLLRESAQAGHGVSPPVTAASGSGRGDGVAETGSTAPVGRDVSP